MTRRLLVVLATLAGMLVVAPAAQSFTTVPVWQCRASATFASVAGNNRVEPIVANGNIVIPPFGTSQRKYADVLGTHRLKLGDGYALHGTNQPGLIPGRPSHGCVRVTNRSIRRLAHLMPIGTPVRIR